MYIKIYYGTPSYPNEKYEVSVYRTEINKGVFIKLQTIAKVYQFHFQRFYS